MRRRLTDLRIRNSVRPWEESLSLWERDWESETSLKECETESLRLRIWEGKTTVCSAVLGFGREIMDYEQKRRKIDRWVDGEEERKRF